MATPFERLEGKYEILTKIREGGMGSVYKVRHRLLDEVRVIKVMRPHLASDEVLRARFLREAKVAIKLHHPNVAQIYDFTIDENDYAYLVMEFIDGFNLQEVTKILDRPPVGIVLEIAHQSLHALGYLHRKRLIHRDVSPDNLLVTRDEDGDLLVKLIDLGIVKVHHEGDESLTSAGTFLGKVRYSSPEHFRTHEGAQLSEASDLYSFGVVLYEMLTTVYPIKGSSVASLISGHLMHEPIDFASSDPDGNVPEELQSVILKCLEKDPANRYPSARHLRDALEPMRQQHPVEDDALSALFEVPNITTRKMATLKPGSSQSRIEQSFRAETTPSHGDTDIQGDDFESSGTIETGNTGLSETDAAREARKPQIRALLLGAGKLVEAQHFEEARLQIASALELDPDNTEASRLLEKVEAADLETKQRRQDAADRVRAAVERESFDTAASELEAAISELGEAAIFEDLQAEIERAKQAFEKRRQRVREIETDAERLVGEERFEDAIARLGEGLELEPGNRGLKEQLEVAEHGLEAQKEAQRRQQEIDTTAAEIQAKLTAGEADEAERALALAINVYGEEQVFSTLKTKLDELRHKQRLDRAAALRKEAREMIEAHSYENAIQTLEAARELVPEASETDDLLAAAREGIQVQEEARRRQAVIDDASLKIERLRAAGRLESAVRLVDETVAEIGTFDEEQPLRDRLESEISDRDALGSRVRSALEEVLEHASEDDYSEANETLEAARELVADHPEMLETVQETERELQRRLEAHRRRMALDNVIASVVTQVEKGALDEARRELGVATRLYGASDELSDLDSKIEVRERELRRQQIQDLVAQARGKKRKLEDSITDLEEALVINPDNEQVHRLLAELRAEQRRRLEEAREQESEPALRAIDELIASGELQQAARRVDAVIADGGDFPAIRSLRQRLAGILGEGQ